MCLEMNEEISVTTSLFMTLKKWVFVLPKKNGNLYFRILTHSASFGSTLEVLKLLGPLDDQVKMGVSVVLEFQGHKTSLSDSSEIFFKKSTDSGWSENAWHTKDCLDPFLKSHDGQLKYWRS